MIDKMALGEFSGIVLMLTGTILTLIGLNAVGPGMTVLGAAIALPLYVYQNQ